MIFFFFSLLLPIFSTASDSIETLFFHPFNHSSKSPIENIAIIGERCSGTNFIRNFLTDNFPKYRICSNLDETEDAVNEYAHKHYFPWIDLHEFQIRKIHENTKELNFLKNSNNTLFIFVIRDPYDWIRSFYVQPFAVHPDLLNKDFWHFLTSQWIAPIRDVWEPERWNPYKERPFKNILELRTYKILNYLQIGLSVEHFLVIPYEKASKDPEKLAAFVSDFFQLENTTNFVPTIYYKGWDKMGVFQKKLYPPFTKKELKFINKQLDWKVESLVGYTKITNQKDIDERS